MRIVFVSGAPFGGAAKSTHELARRLAGRGHDVSVLLRRADGPRRAYLYRRAVNLRVKLDRRTSHMARAVDVLCRQVGSRMRPGAGGPGYRTREAVLPQNALPALIREDQPEVVVVASVGPVAWPEIRNQLRRRRVPSVLYIRERTSVLQPARAQPDLLLANAKAHADAAEALGHRCLVVPSIIDLDAARTETTRRTVLLVNPIASYGVERAWQLARARPDVPFALQESWPLSDEAVAELEAQARQLPNVEIRRFKPEIRQVYSDARVLLVPYAEDNRPRVVAEAHVSGIPVLATARSSLEEAVGPGGILVPEDASDDEWGEGLGRIWDDPVTYATLSEAAARHSQRAELQPETVVSTFEAALERLVVGHRAAAPP